MLERFAEDRGRDSWGKMMAVVCVADRNTRLPRELASRRRATAKLKV